MLLARIRQMESSGASSYGASSVYDDDFLGYEHRTHWSYGPDDEEGESCRQDFAPRPSLHRQRSNTFPGLSDHHGKPHAQLAEARKALSSYLANLVRAAVQHVDAASPRGHHHVVAAVSQHLEQYSKSYLALRALDINIANRIACQAYFQYKDEAQRLAHTRNRAARRWKPRDPALEEKSDEDMMGSDDEGYSSSHWTSQRTTSVDSSDSADSRDSSPASSPSSSRH